MRTFLKLYDHYKNDFDLEILMLLNRTTYARTKKKQMMSEEWI